jgi:hypothetical protein
MAKGKSRETIENKGFTAQHPLFPLDGFGSAVPSFQLHPVFGAVSS